MPEYDCTVPCLCCNEVVVIRSIDWSPRVVGMCMECYARLPLSMIRLIFSLRIQIAHLSQQLMVVQQNINKLFSAQQDMEEMLAE